MCRINVREHLQSSCLMTAAKGVALKKELNSHFMKHDTCIVDFSEIEYFTSSFWRSSYIDLANQHNFSFEEIQKKLVLKGLGEDELNLIETEISKHHTNSINEIVLL